MACEQFSCLLNTTIFSHCLLFFSTLLNKTLSLLSLLLDVSSFSMILKFQVENNPYDPSLMVFMDYRDYKKEKREIPEAEYPTFLYVMPMSPTRVFFEVRLLCCLMFVFLVIFRFFFLILFYFIVIVKILIANLITGNMSSFKRCHAL